jgi:hypothetical protein
VELQDGFDWPHFSFTPTILKELEFPPETSSIHLYRVSSGNWIKMKYTNVVTVETNACLFVKATADMRCKSFDQHIQPPESATIPHFRCDLRHERVFIKKALQKRAAARIPLSLPEALSSGTSKCKCSPATPQPDGSEISSSDPERVEPQAGSLIDNSDDSMPPPERQIVGEGKRADEPNSPIEVESDSSGLTSKKVSWPRDFYVLDIALCFEACEGVSGEQVPEIFGSFFDAPFRRSTFYEHRDRWRLAPQAAEDQALAAGHEPSGLWSQFMARNPAKHAETKAARKRAARVRLN